MSIPHISLEQWRALIAVVEAGGYAQAAESLFKSQSTVTYAVQKIESILDVKAFEVQGRKARLTPTGQLLYRRAKALLEEANGLEKTAKTLSAGWEAEIGIAVEILFPSWLLLDCFSKFGLESPHTRIELIESVMGGTSEALLKGEVQIAISPQIPPGFTGVSIMHMRFVPVANPDHALHKLDRKLTLRDLRKHRHLVVRDSGTKRTNKSPFMEAEQRWTVSSMSTSIQAAALGHGFAWFPEEKIRAELTEGRLKVLPMKDGQERFIDLYLIIADPEGAGPGTLRLAEIIKEAVKNACAIYIEQSGSKQHIPSFE